MWLCGIAVFILVLCPVHCDFVDFFKDISKEFGDAWERLKDAIKQPVRIRRLGVAKPKRTERPFKSTAKVKMPWRPSRTKPPTTSSVPIIPVPQSRRVMIPLLRRSDQYLPQWTRMQNPYISGLKAQEFMLKDGKGFGVMLERTIFPTPTPPCCVSSNHPVVPVLKQPIFRSLEQWRYLQLPRYVTVNPMRFTVKAPTRIAYTIDSWSSEKNREEIIKPQRAEHDYLSHTLLTENMSAIPKPKRKDDEILVSRLKSIIRAYLYE